MAATAKIERKRRSKTLPPEAEQDNQSQNVNKQRVDFFEKYEWWFVILGLVGNGFFFLGSVFFLFKSLETIAICMFIAGSCFMLVSSSAESIAEYSRNKTA